MSEDFIKKAKDIMQETYDALNERNRKLYDNNTNLIVQNNELKDRITPLERENAELIKLKDVDVNDLLKLQTHVEKCESDIVNLYKDNQELKKQLSQARRDGYLKGYDTGYDDGVCNYASDPVTRYEQDESSLSKGALKQGEGDEV